MRWGAFVLVVAACAPHFDRTAHTGLDGHPWGAHRLPGDVSPAHARGVVTARGGDSADWFAFEVRDGVCGNDDVQVSLRYRTPRPHLHLALAVFDESRRSRWVGENDRHRHRAVMANHLPAGRYFARVSAPGPDDAGTYDLDVSDQPPQCDQRPPPVVTRRPSSYQRPTLTQSLDHEVVDVLEIGTIWRGGPFGYAVIDQGTTAIAPDWSGFLVDGAGAPIPGTRLTITELRADAAIARFDDADVGFLASRDAPIWTAELSPPPPAPKPRITGPVDAALTSVRANPDGDVTLLFDRGSADGVVVGASGELAHASGVRVPNARFVIVEVGAHDAVGVGSFVLTDPDHLRAIIGSP